MEWLHCTRHWAVTYIISAIPLTSLVAQMVKRLPTMCETWVRSLGWENALEKEMATYSNTLAWQIPWTEEPGRLQLMGSQRVGHDWATSLSSLSFSILWQKNYHPHFRDEKPKWSHMARISQPRSSSAKILMQVWSQRKSSFLVPGCLSIWVDDSVSHCFIYSSNINSHSLYLGFFRKKTFLFPCD